MNCQVKITLIVTTRGGVPRGEIKNLEGLGMYVLAFRDPDNVQLELAAPHNGS